MNHIADANKMVSDTPRTNGCLTEILDADGFVDQSNCPERWVNHARELERELNAANDRIKRLEDARAVAAANSLANMLAYEDAVAKIKRLEEAGDYLEYDLKEIWSETRSMREWTKAKEAKP